MALVGDVLIPISATADRTRNPVADSDSAYANYLKTSREQQRNNQKQISSAAAKTKCRIALRSRMSAGKRALCTLHEKVTAPVNGAWKQVCSMLVHAWNACCMYDMIVCARIGVCVRLQVIVTLVRQVRRRNDLKCTATIDSYVIIV